jgi:peroxin-11B
MQLGKPLEHLQAALRAHQSPSEPGERFTSIARQLSYAGYLTFDALAWAHVIRFISLQPTTVQRVNRAANRLWLAGVLFSITHGLLKAGRLANEAKRLRAGTYSEKAVGAEAERQAQSRALNMYVVHIDYYQDHADEFNRQRTATRYQFALDCIDVWLPASALGLVGLNDGLVGLCGFVTSIMSLRTQWEGLKIKRD